MATGDFRDRLPALLAAVAAPPVLVALAIGIVIHTWPRPRERTPIAHIQGAIDYSTWNGLDSGSGSGAAQPLPDFLSQPLAVERQRARTMSEWVVLLREAGPRVCFESCPGQAIDQGIAFELETSGDILANILDALVTFDSRYRWDYWEAQHLVNVMPKSSRLDVLVGDVSFKARPLISCLAEPVLVERAKVKIPFVMGPRNPTNQLYWPFDVTAKGATARDYLNLMVVQYDGMVWHISPNGSLAFYMPDDAAAKVRSRLRGRNEKGQSSQSPAGLQSGPAR